MASLILFALEQNCVHVHTLVHMFVYILHKFKVGLVFFFFKLQRRALDRGARIQAVCACAVKYDRTFSWGKTDSNSMEMT